MNEAEDARRAEKRERSEAQRIESLKRRQELEKSRRLQMSSLLNSVDSKKSAKIVFEDSDSDGDEQEKSVKHSSMALFDENESDDEDEGLAISNRHSGPKGIKLMKMEAKFNNDGRFRMDDKFASSDSEDEDINDPSVIEKQKNRQLLEKVLGKTLRPQPNKQPAKGSKTRPFTRFDPDNKEHVQWMKMFGGNQTESDNKIGEKEVESETEEVSPEDRRVEGQFFDVSSTFADELRDRLSKKDIAPQDSGFSFLKAMGREQPDVNQENAFKNNIALTVPTVSASSQVDTVKEKKLLFAEGRSDCFFITGDEPNVKSVVANFRRTQAVEKMTVKWSSYRDSIEKIYQHIRKNTRKNDRFNNRTLFKKVDQRKPKSAVKPS